MKPNIAHAMINGEPAFAQAHRILHRELVRVGPDIDQTSTARLQRMRVALSHKVRQALLLAAFKELEDGDDEPLASLSARAQNLLHNTSWTMSVAEFVYRAYGVEACTAVHPPMDMVEREALSSMQKIATVLGGLGDTQG